MNAITVWQPWAQWIALGWKMMETRWHNRLSILVGQRIAIHAGKKFDESAFARALPFMPTERMECARRMEYPPSRIVCTAQVVGCREMIEPDSVHALCEYHAASYVLILDGLRCLHDPLPCPGKQGIWTVPAEIEQRLPQLDTCDVCPLKPDCPSTWQPHAQCQSWPRRYHEEHLKAQSWALTK